MGYPPTPTKLVCVLYFVAVSRSLGWRRKASKDMETTLVVIVSSLSSVVRNVLVPIPAFARTASTRGSSVVTFLANAWTEA